MRKVIISIVIILVLWIIISNVFHPAEYLFPSFKNVIKDFKENHQVFLQNTTYTILEVLIGLTCFIPILINVLAGAKDVIYKYKDLINLYNLTKIQKTKYFVLPGIIPYLMSAFKISSSLAIVGALVSEFISANKGLGYLIISNYYSMNIAGVFVCIILSSMIGIVIYYSCDIIEKKLIR